MYNDHVILAENAINFEIALSIHGLVIMGIEISWNDIWITAQSNTQFIIMYLISHV